jgi:hypothetical protein
MQANAQGQDEAQKGALSYRYFSETTFPFLMFNSQQTKPYIYDM